jgi:hypothetical protein
MGTNPLTCPLCHAPNTRRSRRRTVGDYLLGAAGVLPWRCETCEARFHARHVPLRHIIYARCAICGNLELQRISAEHVPGITSFVARVLRIPALRCAPCRHKFFSVRPLRRESGRVEAAQSD